MLEKMAIISKTCNANNNKSQGSVATHLSYDGVTLLQIYNPTGW